MYTYNTYTIFWHNRTGCRFTRCWSIHVSWNIFKRRHFRILHCTQNEIRFHWILYAIQYRGKKPLNLSLSAAVQYRHFNVYAKNMNATWTSSIYYMCKKNVYFDYYYNNTPPLTNPQIFLACSDLRGGPSVMTVKFASAYCRAGHNVSYILYYNNEYSMESAE